METFLLKYGNRGTYKSCKTLMQLNRFDDSIIKIIMYKSKEIVIDAPDDATN